MNLNNLAWMYTQCERELDRALELSQRAVQLAPSSAVYLDTLAEVHFRRGNSQKAVELMRECVYLDPREPHYRENLDRFSNR
jgi:tetratricopeptide (TPR) repeat protein